MLNKNVCPKCGQLYDVGMAKCPLCGLPAQAQPEPEAPVQRRRLTEVERRERQKAQRREAAEARRQEREARRAADAEEERLLEEEEERERLEKQRRKLERRGLTPAQIDRKLEGRSYDSMDDDAYEQTDAARIPASFLVAAIVLLVASLLIGGSYLLWRSGTVSIGLYDRLSGAQTETPETNCTGIVLSAKSLEMTAAGQTYAMEYELTPADCTLPVTFQSSDETVAQVGELGIVTSVGPGTATITVTCGEASAVCEVLCSFETEPETEPESYDLSNGLVLSETDITFFEAGENIYLHVTNVPAETNIFWASSNEDVATVADNGHVVAVGKGTCYITAVVDNITESCIVRCNFDD